VTPRRALKDQLFPPASTGAYANGDHLYGFLPPSEPLHSAHYGLAVIDGAVALMFAPGLCYPAGVDPGKAVAYRSIIGRWTAAVRWKRGARRWHEETGRKHGKHLQPPGKASIPLTRWTVLVAACGGWATHQVR
jgi:hypothetical protein